MTISTDTTVAGYPALGRAAAQAEEGRREQAAQVLNGPLRHGVLWTRGTFREGCGLQSDVRRAAVAPGPN